MNKWRTVKIKKIKSKTRPKAKKKRAKLKPPVSVALVAPVPRFHFTASIRHVLETWGNCKVESFIPNMRSHKKFDIVHAVGISAMHTGAYLRGIKRVYMPTVRTYRENTEILKRFYHGIIEPYVRSTYTYPKIATETPLKEFPYLNIVSTGCMPASKVDWSKRPLFLWARHSRTSCPRVLLEIWPYILEKHPNASLIVLGRPRVPDELLKQPGIHITRKRKQPVFREIVRRSDIVFSFGKNKGFGVSTLEALKLGTVVIYAEENRAVQLTHDWGAYCTKWNGDDILKDVLHILDNLSEYRARYSKFNREKLACLTPGNSAKVMVSTYRELLGQVKDGTTKKLYDSICAALPW